MSRSLQGQPLTEAFDVSYASVSVSSHIKGFHMVRCSAVTYKLASHLMHQVLKIYETRPPRPKTYGILNVPPLVIRTYALYAVPFPFDSIFLLIAPCEDGYPFPNTSRARLLPVEVIFGSL